MHLLFFALTAAASAAQFADRELPVCIDRNTPEVVDASAQAARIFASIGVKVRWMTPATCDRSTGTVTVEFSYRRPMHRGTLGYATPYAGRRVVLMGDNLHDRRSYVASSRLAYTLVHEIAHVVQGIARHSETGIMKANWEPGDDAAMRNGSLQFASIDVELIRAGLNAEVARRTK